MHSTLAFRKEKEKKGKVARPTIAQTNIIIIARDTWMFMYMYNDNIHVHVKQTNKAKQHSTPKAVTFPRKNELPQV